MYLQGVNCCNIEQVGRVFEMPPNGKMRRVLVFLDECQVCGRSRALIKKVEYNGSINTVVNRTGSKAVELFEKYKNQKVGFYSAQNGSKCNMYWLWWDGLKDNWVRDFNGTKIFQLN